jgi:membrane protease YdiL (CAAX protease family)
VSLCEPVSSIASAASTDNSRPGRTIDGQFSSTASTKRHLLAIEIAALTTLTVADAWGLVPLSRTPFLLLLGWASLRLRGLSWRDAGFRRPPRFARAVAIGVVAGLAIELFAIAVTTPLIAAATGHEPDVSDLQPVVGNLALLLVAVTASWLLAAFGEELAFRGYLLNRVGALLGATNPAWVISLVVVSAFFGIGHATQGFAGILQESLSGCWLGVLFLAAGRNLTIPIVAHGVSNMLALVLIYFGTYPGLT